jgi:hypothetical protein
MGPPPYSLAPRTLLATPRHRAPLKSDRAAVAEHPPLPRRDGPPAQVAGPLGRASRALLWAEPKCTVHFLNYLSISFELIQINSEFD